MRHLFVHRVEDVQTKLIVIVILEYINYASIIAIILSDRTEEPPRFIAQSHFLVYCLLFTVYRLPFTVYGFSLLIVNQFSFSLKYLYNQ